MQQVRAGICLTILFMFVAPALAEDDVQLPEGKGREAVEAACTVCHTAERIVRQKLTLDQWRGTLREMLENGAALNPDQWEPVVAYLAANFGPPVNVNTASAAELAASLQLTPAEAQSIVAWRQSHGPFRTPADLAKVPGLDTKKTDAKKDRIEF